VKVCIFTLLIVFLAGTAVAAPITISVTALDDEGNVVPVSGARVVVVAADGLIYAEQLVTLSPHATDKEGRVVVERPAGQVAVIAGIALRGFSFAWLSPHDEAVTLDLPKESVLRGFVVDEEGSPIPGAEVLAAPERPSDTGDFLSPGSIVFREFTGADGTFRFLRLSTNHRYHLKAAAPDFAPAHLRDIEIDATPALLRLGRGATVRGLVMLVPEGKGVPGCRVELGGVSTATDDEGKFELRAVPPGRATLTVTAAGRLYREDEELVLAEGDLREGIVIRVIGLGSLRGRVLTPSTTPAAGAKLYLRYPPDPGLADRLPPDRILLAGETDAEGRFELNDLLPAQGVDLIVVHEDHAPTAHLGYSIVAGRSFETLVLLRQGGNVAGRILDAEGREPVAGARVLVLDSREETSGILSGERALLPATRETESDEDGNFLVENIAPGRKNVVVLSEGRVPEIIENVNVASGFTRRGVFVFLGAGSRISGRVVGASGKPIAGATLSLVPQVGTTIVKQTSADGSFVASGIPSGAYDIHVTADGYVPTVEGPVEAPAEHLEVVLRRGEGLAGRILDGVTRRPAGGATVRALRRAEASALAPGRIRFVREATLRADPETGQFSFHDLPPGRYRLEAWTDDHRHGTLDAVEIAPGAEQEAVELRIFSGWALTGRVVSLRTGMPVEGAVAALRTDSDEPGPHMATTDASGHYRLDGVAAGFHTLIVTARGHSPARLESIEVLAAATTTAPEILLREGAVVSGRILGPDGTPRAGLSLTLQSADLGGTLRAATDENGTFRLENVAAGSWLLEFSDPLSGPGGRKVERLLLVPEQGEVEIDMGTGAGAALAGRITASASPLPHARVRAMRLSGSLRRERTLVTTQADENGHYLLPDLLPGDYLVFVLPSGSSLPPARFEVSVPPGPLTFRDLVLPDAGIEARVEDLETGLPVSGARLVLEREASGAAGTFLELLGGVVGETETDQEGIARFPALPEGSYRIAAYAEGFGQGLTTGIRITFGALTPVRVMLPAAGAVTGSVVDSMGEPVGSATITFLDARGLPATSPVRWPVNANGTFHVPTLRTGRYTLHVTAPGYSTQDVPEIEVFPGGKPEIRVVLGRESRIRITVFGPGGARVTGARISVTDFWGRAVPFPASHIGLLAPYRDPTLTDEMGQVLLAGLGAGIYTVRATLPGHAGDPARIRVLAGELVQGAVVLLPVDKGR
jgi:large repetitive protein